MTDIPGIILAGGLSRRMGGGDKGLLQLGEKSLIQMVIDKISPQVSSLAININGDSSRFPNYELPIIPDSMKGYLGPLSGILAGCLLYTSPSPRDRLLSRMPSSA